MVRRTYRRQLLQERTRDSDLHQQMVSSTAYSLKFKQIKNIIQWYFTVLPMEPDDDAHAWILSGGVKTVFWRALSLGTFLSPNYFYSRVTRSHTLLHFKGNHKDGEDKSSCSHIVRNDEFIPTMNNKRFKIKRKITVTLNLSFIRLSSEFAPNNM